MATAVAGTAERSVPPPVPAGLPAKPAKKADRVFVVVLVLLALAAAGWFFAGKLAAVSQVQDCVMSGRKNCVQVDDPNPR